MLVYVKLLLREREREISHRKNSRAHLGIEPKIS